MTNNFKKSWVAAALLVGTSLGSLQAQVLRKVSTNKGEATQRREMQITRSGAVNSVKTKSKITKTSGLVNSIAGSTLKNTHLEKAIYANGARKSVQGLNQTQAATCVDLATSNYATGFETSADTVGLQFFDVNADNTKWFVGNTTTLAHTGTKVLVYQYSATNAADDWTTTRCLTLVGGQAYKLQFYYRVGGATFPENLKVAFGNAASPASMTTTIIDLPGITNATYQLAEATFTPATSGSYYLGFHAYSTADQYRILVDDITVSKVASADIAVTDIKYPDSQCGMGSGEVTVFVKNNGSAAITSADLSLAINSATQSGSVSNLAAGATDSVTFSVDFSTPGDYVMQATATLAGDVEASNDTSATVAVSHLSPIDFSTGTTYANSFETDADYLGMSLLDENNDGVSWYASTVLPRTGTTCLAYQYNADGTTAANDWVVTRCLSFEAGQTYKLSFWYRNSDADYGPEKLLVAYGNAATAAALTNVLVDLPSISNSTAYQQAEATFTPTVSGTYYIGFKAYTDANKWRVYVDDISLVKQVSEDARVTKLTVPVSQCGLSSSEVVTVYVNNNGTSTLASVPVSLSVNGTVTSASVDNLAAGATDSLMFNVDLSTPGTVYNVVAYTTLSTDGVISNDTSEVAKVTNIAPVDLTAGPYAIGFETTDELVGATILDENNDGVTWGIFANATLAHTGTNSLAYQYNSDGVTAANDWVVSRCVNLEAGKAYKLSFWYRNSDADYIPEKMLVAYGMSPDAASLTNVLVDLPNISNSTAYEQAEATFTAAVSGTYYFGFKAYTDADKWRIYLDDIELKELSGTDVGAVALVAPKGCSGSGQVIAVAVKNYGLDATNIPVTVEFSGAATASVSDVLPTLAAGAIDTLYFSTTVDLTTEGTVFVKTYTVSADDTEPNNDAKYDTLNVVFPTTLPYSEDYNTVASGELPTGWTSGDQEFYTEPGRGVGNSNVLYLNLYSNTSSETTHGELYSPAFSGFTGTQYISFLYKLINYSGGAPYTLVDGDSLQIEYSTDCGATFTRLTSINASTFTSSAAYKVMRFPLAALGSVDNVKFRFVGTYGGNGDYIHLIDNLEIGDVPSNDLAVISLTTNAKYTITPKAHIPTTGFTFNSTVLNSGMNFTTNVVSKIKVTPGTYADSTSFATLASTTSSAFTPAAAFTPTEAGQYTVTASAYASETEQNTSNNSITLPLAISDSTMAKDHESPVGGLGIGAGTANGIFQKYELKYGTGLQDTLTSVTFWVGALDAPTTVKAMVYRATNAGGLNTNTAALDSTAALTIPVDGANQFHTISFKKATGLGTILTTTTANNSKYFIGLREKANNMRLGYEIPTSYTANDVLIRLNNAWSDVETLLGAGVTFYIRPNFGKYNPVVGVSKVNNSLNVAAYPNPTTGILNLAFDRNEVQPTAIKVVNMLGATVAEITNASELAGEKVTLNLAGQSAGTYFVHIATQDNVVVRKVVLNR